MTDADRAPLTAEEQSWLAAVREAVTLADLAAIVGVDDDHAAYLEAKERWTRLRERELGPPILPEGLPGSRVTVDQTTFHVHGVTHAGTDAERSFLRSHVDRLLEGGASVYCEQGLRRLFFEDIPAVCEFDDYRWAMQACRELEMNSDTESTVADLVGEPFGGIGEELAAVAGRLSETLRSLADAGRDRYGDRFADALHDVAAELPTDHAELATGEAFPRGPAAATDVAALAARQRHYETAFLPQPLEREWLRRHDPELELLTHARNARMADFAVDAAANTRGDFHLVVGAAHGPGVRFYLEAHRDGERTLSEFSPTV